MTLPTEFTGKSIIMTFDDVDPATYALLVGGPPMDEPTHSMHVRWVDSPIPAAPTKRRGLTGKAYRAARRRHARRVRGWVRSGSPMLERALHVPRVKVQSDTPNTLAVTC